MSQSRLRKAFATDLPQHKIAQINEDEASDVLQVIGAGLPRTGTTSLKAALEILGFNPCHHMAVRTASSPLLFCVQAQFMEMRSQPISSI